MSLAKLRAMITANLDTYLAHEHDERALSSLDFQSQINLLKVEASELAVATVMSAMRACGLSGYRNDGDFTVGRHLRDVLSAPIMINNDRILANIATASLMSGVPAGLARLNKHRIRGRPNMNIAVRTASPESQPADPLDHLADRLFHKMGTDGVYARTALYEDMVERLAALITRNREPGTEVMRFPPVMNRGQLEKSGYLKSFPNLLGCVCGLHGTEREINSAVSRFDAGGDWTTSLSPADLVLSPAACYPVYPIAAARGALPAGGLRFDVAADCFRANRRAISTGCSRSGCANMSASAAPRTSPISASAGWCARKASPAISASPSRSTMPAIPSSVASAR